MEPRIDKYYYFINNFFNCIYLTHCNRALFWSIMVLNFQVKKYVNCMVLTGMGISYDLLLCPYHISIITHGYALPNQLG